VDVKIPWSKADKKAKGRCLWPYQYFMHLLKYSGVEYPNNLLFLFRLCSIVFLGVTLILWSNPLNSLLCPVTALFVWLLVAGLYSFLLIKTDLIL